MNKRKLLSLCGLGALFGSARATTPIRAAGLPLVLGFFLNTSNEPTVLEGEGSIDVLLKVTAKGGAQAHAVQATGGDSVLDTVGGTALVAEGGSTTFAGTPAVGDGTQAFGGGAKNARGGTGAFARGGISQSGPGGRGLEAYGGNAPDGAFGGDGVEAIGGLAAGVPGAAPAVAGAGIEAFGGPAFVGQPAGAGVIAQGGSELKPNSIPSADGAGVVAEGGHRKDGGLVLALGVLGVGGGEPGQGATGVYGEASDEFSPGARGSGVVNLSAGAFGHSVNGNGIGVIGNNLGTGPGGMFQSESGSGLIGTSSSGAGVEANGGTLAGLVGESTGGPGAIGVSTTGIGMALGSVNNEGGYFETSNATQPALWAYNSQAAAGGAVGLLVNGDCIVQNGTKPAAVPTSRGPRLLYVVEAATSVFEDVGKVSLRNGRARVELDPLFAETIETRDYQVFFTARGDNKGLYVAARDERGFEIREGAGGTSSIEVSYRIVARRKGLQPNHRLARFRPPEPPKRVELKRPKPPKLRELKLPATRREREHRERRR